MRLVNAVSLGLVLIGTSAAAQGPDPASFTPDKIKAGSDVYAIYCTPCHGPQMEYPGGSFDLRTFPSGQFARFEASVTKGKNNMPPWGEVLQPGELEALWAYVMAGEKKK
jgi:mono/diheme cytochrome c family protein